MHQLISHRKRGRYMPLSRYKLRKLKLDNYVEEAPEAHDWRKLLAY